MAEKQNNDSMVNAQDNDEWVQTKTPVQVPVTPVQPPMTPVIVVKQEELLYVTPDAVLADHRRNCQTKVKVRLFVSCICAYVAFFNVIDLIYMDFEKAAPVDIWVAALKTTVGLFGVILLVTNIFTAIKAYAVAFMVVYACYTGFFLYQAFTDQNEITAKMCGTEKLMRGRASYSECLDRVWIALMWRVLSLTLFTIFGFVVTWDYTTKAKQFMKAEEERKETGETVTV